MRCKLGYRGVGASPQSRIGLFDQYGSQQTLVSYRCSLGFTVCRLHCSFLEVFPYNAFRQVCPSLVFGLDLKCLVLWQLLLLTCAAPTHAQKYLGKNTFIYLFVSPIDAGSQKCTQGTPSVKGRKKYYLKLVNWYLRSGSKNYANICVKGFWPFLNPNSAILCLTAVFSCYIYGEKSCCCKSWFSS